MQTSDWLEVAGVVIELAVFFLLPLGIALIIDHRKEIKKK